ncbi:hypothetical protein CSUI_006760 [Cystoisospora suis]|uniref:Uncharacterized protein n=1 Tax=Cystoisospora suis TaxID=483139 RepID=A0A2C6KSY5_9APIC|nr:hypothetical protein CSUI_006760 [Cystoisospora suis]
MDCQLSAEARDSHGITEEPAGALSGEPPKVEQGVQLQTSRAQKLRPNQRQTRLSSFFSVVPRLPPGVHTSVRHSTEASEADKPQEKLGSSQPDSASLLSPSDTAQRPATNDRPPPRRRRSNSRARTAYNRTRVLGSSECCVSEDLSPSERKPVPGLGSAPGAIPTVDTDVGVSELLRCETSPEFCSGPENISQSGGSECEDRRKTAGQRDFHTQEETLKQQVRDVESRLDDSTIVRRERPERQLRQQRLSTKLAAVNFTNETGEDASLPKNQRVVLDLTGVASVEEETVASPLANEGSVEAAALPCDSSHENLQSPVHPGPHTTAVNSPDTGGNYADPPLLPATRETPTEPVGRPSGHAVSSRERGNEITDEAITAALDASGEALAEASIGHLEEANEVTYDKGVEEEEEGGAVLKDEQIAVETRGHTAAETVDPADSCGSSTERIFRALAEDPTSGDGSTEYGAPPATNTPCAAQESSGASSSAATCFLARPRDISACSDGATTQGAAQTRRVLGAASASLVFASPTVVSSPDSPACLDQSTERLEVRHARPSAGVGSQGSAGLQGSVQETKREEANTLFSGSAPRKLSAETGNQRSCKKTLTDFFSPKPTQTRNIFVAEDEVVCCLSPGKLPAPEESSGNNVSSSMKKRGRNQSCDFDGGSELSPCPSESGQWHRSLARTDSGEFSAPGSGSERKTRRRLKLQDLEDSPSTELALSGVKDSLGQGTPVVAPSSSSGEECWGARSHRDAESNSNPYAEDTDDCSHFAREERSAAEDIKASRLPFVERGCTVDPSASTSSPAKPAKGVEENVNEAKLPEECSVSDTRGRGSPGHMETLFPSGPAPDVGERGQENAGPSSACSSLPGANLQKRQEGHCDRRVERQGRSGALCAAWSAIFKRSSRQSDSEKNNAVDSGSATQKQVLTATTQASKANGRDKKPSKRLSGRRSELSSLSEPENVRALSPLLEQDKRTKERGFRRSLRACVRMRRQDAQGEGTAQSAEAVDSDGTEGDDDLRVRSGKRRLSSRLASPGLASPSWGSALPPHRSAKKKREEKRCKVVISPKAVTRTDEFELKEKELRKRADEKEEEKRRRQEIANRKLLSQAQQQQREAEEEQRMRLLVERNASWASWLRFLEDGEDNGGELHGLPSPGAVGPERRGASLRADRWNAPAGTLIGSKNPQPSCPYDKSSEQNETTPCESADGRAKDSEKLEQCVGRWRRLRRGVSEEPSEEEEEKEKTVQMDGEQGVSLTEPTKGRRRVLREQGGETTVNNQDEEREKCRKEGEVTEDERQRRRVEVPLGENESRDTAEWVCCLRNISWPAVKAKLLELCGLTGPSGQHATFFVSKGPYTFHSYNSILRILHEAGIPTTMSARRATCILTNDEGYWPSDQLAADAERRAADPASAAAGRAGTEEDEVRRTHAQDYLTRPTPDDLLEPSGIGADAASLELGGARTRCGVTAPWKNVPNSLFDGPPIATESMLMKAMNISLDAAAKRFRPVHDKSGILIEKLVHHVVEWYTPLFTRETDCGSTTRRDPAALSEERSDQSGSRPGAREATRSSGIERTGEGTATGGAAVVRIKEGEVTENEERTVTVAEGDAEWTRSSPTDSSATFGTSSQYGGQLRPTTRKRMRSDTEERGGSNQQSECTENRERERQSVEEGSGVLKPPRVLWLSHLTDTWPRAFEPVCLSELAGNNDVTLKLYGLLTARVNPVEGSSSTESERADCNSGRRRGSWLTSRRKRRGEQKAEVRVIIVIMPHGYGGDRLIELLCYACGYQAIREQKLREEKRIDGLFLSMAASAQARASQGATQDSRQGADSQNGGAGNSCSAFSVACPAKQSLATREAEKSLPDLVTERSAAPTARGGSEGMERGETVARSATAALPLSRISVYNWWALSRSDQRKLLQRKPAAVERTKAGRTQPIICVARWRPGDDADSAREAVEATIDEALTVGTGGRGRKGDCDEDGEGHNESSAQRRGIHVLQILPPSREALVQRVLAVASAAIGAPVDRSFVELLFAASGDGRHGGGVRNPVSVAGILHTLHFITRTHPNSRVLYAAYRHESQRQLEEQQRKLDTCFRTEIGCVEETSFCPLFDTGTIPPVSWYDREPPYCPRKAPTAEGSGSALITRPSYLIQNFVLPPLERPLALPFALAEVPLLASWRLQQEQPKSLLLQLFGRRNSLAADSLAACLHAFDFLHEKFVCNPGSQARRTACETIAEVAERHGSVEALLDAFTACARVVKIENELSGCLFSDVKDPPDVDTDFSGHKTPSEGEGGSTNSILGVSMSRDNPMVGATSAVVRALPLKTAVRLSEDAAVFVGELILGGIALLQHGPQGAYAPPPLGCSLDAVRKQLLCEHMIQQEKLQTRRRMEKAGENSLKVVDLRRSVEEVGLMSLMCKPEAPGKPRGSSMVVGPKKSAGDVLLRDATDVGAWQRPADSLAASEAVVCDEHPELGDSDRWMDDGVSLFDVMSVSTMMNCERQLRQFLLHEGRTLEKKLATGRGGRRSRTQRKRVTALGDEFNLQKITAVVRELQIECGDRRYKT